LTEVISIVAFVGEKSGADWSVIVNAKSLGAKAGLSVGPLNPAVLIVAAKSFRLASMLLNAVKCCAPDFPESDFRGLMPLPSAVAQCRCLLPAAEQHHGEKRPFIGVSTSRRDIEHSARNAGYRCCVCLA